MLGIALLLLGCAEPPPRDPGGTVAEPPSFCDRVEVVPVAAGAPITVDWSDLHLDGARGLLFVTLLQFTLACEDVADATCEESLGQADLASQTGASADPSAGSLTLLAPGADTRCAWVSLSQSGADLGDVLLQPDPEEVVTTIVFE